MRLLVMLLCYVATVLTLVGGAVAGLSVLVAPAKSEAAVAQRPALVRKADRLAVAQSVDVTQIAAAFRYGPEVNHGRSDTPVNYSQQALREARALKDVRASARPAKKRQELYQERRIEDPGVALGFAPVRPSGH